MKIQIVMMKNKIYKNKSFINLMEWSQNMLSNRPKGQLNIQRGNIVMKKIKKILQKKRRIDSYVKKEKKVA